MLSEYLILFLPLVIFFVRSEKGLRNYLAQLILITWVFLLLVGRSRSAWIGLGFCVLYGLFKGASRKEWISYGIAALLFALSFMIPFKGSDYEAAKEGSFHKRLELYKGSSQMLLDHPLGVGGGNFIFNYLPYQMETDELPTEVETFDSPHSEILKWGIENGWAFLLAMGAWWLLLGWKVFRFQGPSEIQSFYRTSYLVIGPQIFFQFPFENPASSFALSLILALFLLLSPVRSFSITRSGRAAFIILAIVLFARAASQTYNRWIESQYFTNLKKAELGCELSPTNWRIRFYSSMLKAETLFPDTALATIQRELRMRPFDYHALRALAMVYQNTREQDKSCEVARVYETFFFQKSSISRYLAAHCSSVKSPFQFRDTSQFQSDYLNWIKKYQ
jgi:hypothetical protein